MATATDEFIPTRSSLLSRLKDWDDQESWRQFFDTYGRLIYGVARKTGLSDADAHDVVQDTVLAVAKKMPEFRYDPAVGSFKGWLLQLTRWRITDQLRKKGSQRGDQVLPREQELGTTVVEEQSARAGFGLEAAWDEEWEKNLMAVATERAKQRVKAIQYQIFHLHVLNNQSTENVCRRLGVTKAQVYFASRKVAALIKKEVKALERCGI